jgi:hypothetical protein
MDDPNGIYHVLVPDYSCTTADGSPVSKREIVEGIGMTSQQAVAVATEKYGEVRAILPDFQYQIWNEYISDITYQNTLWECYGD